MVDTLQAALDAKRAELEDRLRPDSYANQDKQVDYVADELDCINERQRREAAIGEIERCNTLLRLVKRAQNRIASGAYGMCLDCLETIPEKRLKAVPWAERCIKCQEAFDLEMKSVSSDTSDELTHSSD